MDGKTMDLLYNLGIVNISNVVLFIVFGFFGKQLILYFFSETIELKKTELSKELETHKKELNTQTDAYKTDLSKILESHKSELNLFHLKNSKIYERRLEIITELYKKIVLVERYMKEMTVIFKEVSRDKEIRKKEENEKIER
ncbi:MAG: hypothetical protein MUE85_25185, partial [Microscillaceae bacterium]|nr:hypothetical protein [Microscillaceae bacterium]